MLRGEVRLTTSLYDLGRGCEVVEREAQLVLSDNQRVVLKRSGLNTGDAVTIIPYFRDPMTGEWMVVMVSEFRTNVGEVCLEAPGSLVEHGLTPEEQMVKVAKEETSIFIPQNCITMLAVQFVANAWLDQKVWMGVVEISVPDLNTFRAQLKGRMDIESEQEVTEVVIYPLHYLFEHRAHVISNALTSYHILELALHLKMLNIA